jgi:protein subunit release factor B
VGGTEANDWAEMLYRMYIFYLREDAGWEMEEVDEGITAPKSASTRSRST